MTECWYSMWMNQKGKMQRFVLRTEKQSKQRWKFRGGACRKCFTVVKIKLERNATYERDIVFYCFSFLAALHKSKKSVADRCSDFPFHLTKIRYAILC